ncbi:TlyA family RNA methyltransferase [Candidatus Saccharibacteria bacterium]|nr:TlyA family RNA methyltransferase [Candidatus Saccharibacteria bacterium]
MNGKSDKVRFDEYLAAEKLVGSRHQAADLIKRGQIKLNGRTVTKPSLRLDPGLKQRVQLKTGQLYVSRAGYKLAAAAETLGVNFKGKVVLDAGAHLGGFTDVIYQRRAAAIVAVDVGKEPLAAHLRQKDNILSFNRTDIRDFDWPGQLSLPDIIVADLSFISLTKVLAGLQRFCRPGTAVLVLAKPQFEAEGYDLQGGVVKNNLQRRAIFRRLEGWFKENGWAVAGKADSKVAGLKGNLERFYLLRPPVKR